jgi:acetoin utilization protein AcuC
MAGGFCIFNDCSIAIETLKSQHGLERVAYVDIDAHHGDGVYYGFVDDPAVIIADIHEDGRFLFPGTGFAEETGTGPAKGTKLNIPLLPGADDDAFRDAWGRVLPFLDEKRPRFFVMQCGADSVEGDPLTHMAFSPEAHRQATREVRRLAEAHAGARLLCTGGGGYNRANIGNAWCAVVEELLAD